MLVIYVCSMKGNTNFSANVFSNFNDDKAFISSILKTYFQVFQNASCLLVDQNLPDEDL